MEPIFIEHFNLRQIADSGQCFLWQQLAENRYAVRTQGRCIVAAQEGEQFTFSCTQDEFETFWRAYFDLDEDYGAIKAGIDPADAYLTAAAAYGSGMRVLRQDLWEVMISFLISQNNNVKRIGSSVRGLCEAYGRACESPEGTYHNIPEPDDLADATAADFAALGLGYRARYLESLVREMRGDGLPRLREQLAAMADDEAHARLMELTGIGRKVADCICLYGLHRTDRFPVDTHIRQILDTHYPEGFPFARYQGSLGILQQYLFYYKLTAK